MATEAEVVDAQIVDDPTPVVPPAQSTALARRERRSEVLHPLDAGQLAQSFQEYQELLPRLLTDSDYQQAGDRRFVKKSGWRKIAAAFDLDVVLVSDEVERDESGRVIRAKVLARAIAPSGRTMDGDGYCSADESRFTSTRADLSKLENDLRGTATTRAKNRAIADLVGMGDVSAEEVTATGLDSGPQYGIAAAGAALGNASKALTKLCGGDVDLAEQTWGQIKGHMNGYMPMAAALTMLKLASVVKLGVSEPDRVIVDDRGDVPTEDPQAAERAGLEDQAFEMWSELETPAKATKRIQECRGNLDRLQALCDAAGKALEEKSGVAA